MLRFALLALALVALSTLPVSAAESPVFAQSGYWNGFVEHWSNSFAKRNSIVVFVLVIAAVGVFIITRGKKVK